MKQHNTDFWPFLDYFDQYHKYNEARESFFFMGPLRTIHQLFPEQKTKCVSVLVFKLQAYNKTQVQKLHLTLAEPIVFKQPLLCAFGANIVIYIGDIIALPWWPIYSELATGWFSWYIFRRLRCTLFYPPEFPKPFTYPLTTPQ